MLGFCFLGVVAIWSVRFYAALLVLGFFGCLMLAFRFGV